MKNLKEIQPILTAIYCLNQTNRNRDKDICRIIEYAFHHIIDGNINLLTVFCAGKTKAEIMPGIKQLLSETTNYQEDDNGNH